MEHEIFNSDEENNSKSKKKEFSNLFSFENIPFFLVFASIFFTIIAKVVSIASVVAAVIIAFIALSVAFSAFVLNVISLLKKNKFNVKDGVCLAVTMFAMLISIL